MRADDDVIEADDCCKHAHGKNDRKRCETGGDKCQPEHVGLACAPVAVQQPSRALPINVARPMYTRSCVENDILCQLCHCCPLGVSIARLFTGKLFLRPRWLDYEITQSDVPTSSLFRLMERQVVDPMGEPTSVPQMRSGSGPTMRGIESI